MPSLVSLPTEIIQFIFAELQDVTSGPRYTLVPPTIDIVHTRIEDRPANMRPEDLHATWKLKDPGPLNFAFSSKTLRDTYLSEGVIGNLILEIPSPILPEINYGKATRPWEPEPLQTPYDLSAEPPAHLRVAEQPISARDQPYEWWRITEQNGNLLTKLKRMKCTSSYKRVSRFMLDSKWDADTRMSWSTCSLMLCEIFKDVSEIFGVDLVVAICCAGLDVEKDFRAYSPRNVEQLERLGRNLNRSSHRLITTSADEKSAKSCSTQLRSGRTAISRSTHPTPPTEDDLSASTPLSLHLYFGYGQHYADLTMGNILNSFANKNLESLYFCSDPNNFNLVGHARRPAEGRDLYMQRNRYSFGNPWRYLLPTYSSAHETLKSITLDCSLFWSEIAYVLPHLHKLERLDCHLTLIHTEPMYPMLLEGKNEASRRVLDTCLNSETNMQRERALKKNKAKKWIEISKENIMLPAIEPVVKEMPVG